MNDQDRRTALGQFLRGKRESLSPEDYGLPTGSQRRTPGLRREEVALLANMGTSWYIWLEQGRDVHPSVQILDSLSRALRLSANERRHLFLLAGESLPPLALPEEEVSPTLQSVLDDLNPVPAYVMGRRWDFLAWNAMAGDIFAMDIPAPPYHYNLVWRLFTLPIARQRYLDWERVARSVISEFHTARARYMEDEGMDALIRDLKEASPDFSRLWLQHDPAEKMEGHKEIEHSVMGHLEFEHITLQAPEDPDLKVMIYSPSPETRVKLQEYHSALSRS
ncbi:MULTISPECIES: helix-turn-helix transcriptional regulator [Paenibacillus]|uniref:helix-turn-helix transcriptional regulator n=1 Tax=Paenibacillus TaxID=44249 RepID=UPI000E262195|nr:MULTISPECIES: helix-turn-helix transcriptional regulator [Paenibacillus]RED36798.1 helix-turn-helix protein [Paenibacillus sp. VMFN-D1]GIO63907.1 transcriptional regulator [Paenibacillus cineris]